MSDHAAEEDALQLGLVRMQQAMAASGARAIVVLEGRDTAGKDGTIKRVTEHLSVRNTRVVALPKPSDRERSQWYFQRYVAHLPAAGELVIFNRSWYNRAGVEVVNGFSTPAEQARFLADVPGFEAMLVESGIALVKLWLDISKEEQAERLERRRTDPLKALKVSALDAVAQDKWDDYTAARDAMLTRTHIPLAPWICVRADNKKRARRNVIRHLLRTLAPAEVAAEVKAPKPEVLFPFEMAALEDGRLAR
ncbi:polyphosphate kinase 2 [Sphingomonas corticis]|jgi:polyphosphate kinase 2|uniref:ADP/GDP-polyphosphate phosphotransferase n=1 Tax=Sphingomonas corticis TaxID=2722791 RepID=A0ABX1CS59_9SPHN|nr:polyphosphate kinase 2 [Sphingomonas corticis]NJR78845.1 polyphosphate kinase 2 [Sphingomonas corticis]